MPSSADFPDPALPVTASNPLDSRSQRPTSLRSVLRPTNRQGGVESSTSLARWPAQNADL